MEDTYRKHLIDEWLAAKADADRAQRRLKEYEDKLLALMAERHTKTIAVDEDEVTHRLTFVQRETVKIDEKGLRKALRAKVFDKYTVKKLDRKKLEAAMDQGEVDPTIVSKYAVVEPSAPYLRYTEGVKA